MYVLNVVTLDKQSRYLLTYKMACAPSEDSDQPGHPSSLISLWCLLEQSLGATHWAQSKDSDQPGQMPRMIRIFAGPSCHFVDFVMCWLVYYIRSYITNTAASLGNIGSWQTGPSCSKLTMSLVNESLKFTSSDTQICWNFLLKKCEQLLQCKSYSHFFSKKYQNIVYWIC